MLKKPLLLLLAIIAFRPVSGQVREVIDRDIAAIKYLPYGQFGAKGWKQDERTNAKYRKENPAYREILALDTLAIPYLIDRIADTTEANLRVPCAAYNLKVGDIAFALLNDIVLIPWHTVTQLDWDSYSCDSLPDGGWGYLHHERTRFQQQLKAFFKSHKGRIWVQLFKDKKLNKNERAELVKRFRNIPDEVPDDASSTGDSSSP